MAKTPERLRIVVVDDHASMAETLAEGLEENGYEAAAFHSGAAAARAIENGRVDAVVTDLRMPDVDGLALVALSRKRHPDAPVVVMTAYSAVDSAIQSIRHGAYHYLTKPFKVAELVVVLEKAFAEGRLRREAASLRSELRQRLGLAALVGRSEAMQLVSELVARVADAAAPVLILGETGTGKGLVAHAIHAQGRRAGGRFITVNCAALPETLLESELFGHTRGAFTGASTQRMGLLEAASGGTLFLDEIAEMSPAVQAKLLHVLESGSVRAIGSDQERRIDTRIVSATHRQLRDRVASGAFREDLFYRLDVVTIEIPPLRLRGDDVALLIEHFLRQAKEKHPHSPVETFSPDALAVLLAHLWPGNVRELEHVVERVVLLGRERSVSVRDLPATLATKEAGDVASFRLPIVSLREIQRRYAAWAFQQLGSKKVLTAEKLDVDFRTLVRLLGAPSRDGGDRE